MPWGKWGAPNLHYFNLLSVHCHAITSQEHWGNIFFCGPVAVCSLPARNGGIGIPFQLAQLMTLSHRDADMNDKGDLTSAIKQYSFSLTLNELHSCSALSCCFRACIIFQGPVVIMVLLRSIQITRMFLNRIRTEITYHEK